MPRDGAHTISDYRSLGVERFEIACRRCPRRGSYNLESALTRWGDMKLTDLLLEVSADCQNGKGVDAYDRCGVYYPAPPAGA